jgi:hypothetical protein
MKNLLEKTEYSRISTAEEEAEKRRREREDERGDSGGWWPSVRSGIHALRGRAGDRGRRSPRFD